jgi:hypothetical protein
MKHSGKLQRRLCNSFVDTSGILEMEGPLIVDFQMTTLPLTGQDIRRRPQMPCVPLRLRATITIDMEVGDYLEAQRSKASVEDLFDEIRQRHEDASLEFKQRRPRVRPRPGAPGPIIAAYADD